MTYSKQRELDRKKKAGRRRKRSGNASFAEDLHEALATQTNAVTRVTFPSKRWRDDPVGFFRLVLGVEPWEKQIEVIESIRDNKRVAVKSGHKVSKSHTAAGVALWYYCSFEDARVVMTSTTSRQVDQILWRELRMIRARSGVCVDCKELNKGLDNENQIVAPCPHSAIIDGEIGELARTGLKSSDFREIVGFTAREAEAVAGISGKNLLYILDEASGIKPEIYQAIEGNRAGGARVAMFSNPTRTSGDFYEAFTEKSEFYALHTISSEETPNVKYGEHDSRAIPGLAGPDWIAEKQKEWGVDSPLYKVRVLGLFAELEEAKIFSVEKIAEAEERWADTPGEGRLFIGIDPAGETGVGDETVWAPVRGKKNLSLIAMRGLSPEAHLIHTLGMVSELRTDEREIPVVILDVEGETGHKVYGIFSAFLAPLSAPPFELVAMRSSDGAHRTPVVYDRQRDELCGNLLMWVNNGGAIVEDVKLAKELNALKWIEQEKTGKIKLIAKKELRKILGRSPDRYDALANAVWRPLKISDKTTPRKQVNNVDLGSSTVPAMDPYDTLDPY